MKKAFAIIVSTAVIAAGTMISSIAPAAAYTHWHTHTHINRFGHGCRTTRVDHYGHGRHEWRVRRRCF